VTYQLDITIQLSTISPRLARQSVEKHAGMLVGRGRSSGRKGNRIVVAGRMLP